MPAWPAAASPGLINSLPSWNRCFPAVTSVRDNRCCKKFILVCLSLSTKCIVLRNLWNYSWNSSESSKDHPNPNPTSSSHLLAVILLPVLWPCFWQTDVPDGEASSWQIPTAAWDPPALYCLCSTCFLTGKPFPEDLFLHVNSVSRTPLHEQLFFDFLSPPTKQFITADC